MNKVYEYVTERIIQKLQEGVIPWHQGWKSCPAINYVTRKPYRGVNTFLLSKGGEYLTFKQIQDLKGKIKKGAKSEFVVFYRTYTRTRTGIGENGEETEITETIPVLRYYNVFHLSDVEGIPSKIQTIQHNPIKEAEEIIAKYIDKPPIVHDDPNGAYYLPVRDLINVPVMEYFRKIEDYYSTIFHEMIHSTGHEKRLNRFPKTADAHMFGSESYSKEELVAELGAAMLCEHVGLFDRTFDNNAAYIQSWIKVLNDNKSLIVRAASKAQKACDYILGINSVKEEVDEE